MKLFTIGFTKKSAEQFFTRLKQPGLVRLVDVRLNNVSQLAGFTKKNDLTVLPSRDLRYRLRPFDGVGAYARHSRCLQEERRRLVGLREAVLGSHGGPPRRGNGR